ncbi:MAG TPA: restriction endonuclease subunit S [Candidatus Ligilactobacillus excrementipullorum]|nr:restriction endonuclease subunit S [Candidatus Ligilactobacillus excrementipullorum]
MKSYKLSELVTIKYGKDHKKLNEGNIPVYGSGGVMRYVDTYLANDESVLIPRKGSLNNIFYVKGKFWTVDTLFWTQVNKDIIIPKYLYYCLKGKNLSSLNVGSAVPSLTIKILEDIQIDVPKLLVQEDVVKKISVIERKIQNNNEINDNLAEVASTLFEEKFPHINDQINPVSNYLLPKRGRNLLKRNVLPGNVPVVAGGLKPAAYHNDSNTAKPVITISSSGANAGYIRLWNEKVWSSDSSFIDPNITDDIYFWYILLKKRQKDIFDMQTGSAQPHIYPKHIGNLLIGNIDLDVIKKFNDKITPIFNLIGKNTRENKILTNIKEDLLNTLVK